MKKIIKYVGLFCIIISLFSCKKEQDLTEFNTILQKWGRSIKEFNYSLYSSCEAYPKSSPVFREVHNEYYLEDIMLVNVEPFDEDRKRKDPDGNEYYYLSADFECTEVKRETKTPVQIVRGNMLFIRFIQGERKRDGWLMSNRTLIRVKR